MNGYLFLYVLLFLAYGALFLWGIARWKFFDIPGVKKGHFAFFFLLKVIAGIGLTLVYTYYYTDADKADIYRYYNDSKVISSLLFQHPQAWWHIITGIGMEQADVYVYLLPTKHFSHSSADLATSNSFLVRLISLLNFFSFSNIYINTLFFNFISFIGLVWLFKALRHFFSGFAEILYLPLFLLPSVVFWGSGLLKEGVLLFGIGLYIHSLWQWQQSNNRWNVLWIILSLLLISSLKLYIAVLLVLCSGLLPIPVPAWRKGFAYVLLLVLAGYGLGGSFCEQIINKRNEFIQLAIAENAGSAIDMQLLQPDCNTLLSLIPSALVNSVLRPFVWEAGKLFQLVFAAENLVLFLIIAFLLVHFFKLPTAGKRWLVAFCLCFALFNYTIIGLSVPVMGAIVHYRIIAGIFMLVAVLGFVDLDKLRTLKWFRKL